MVQIGRVKEIWRYPVKGMAGESLEACALTAKGIEGDRIWALRDNALFISWGPYDNPRYACAVVIEHGGHTNVEFDAPIVTARVLRETFLSDPVNRAAARLATLEPQREQPQSARQSA